MELTPDQHLTIKRYVRLDSNLTSDFLSDQMEFIFDTEPVDFNNPPDPYEFIIKQLDYLTKNDSNRSFESYQKIVRTIAADPEFWVNAAEKGINGYINDLDKGE